MFHAQTIFNWWKMQKHCNVVHLRVCCVISGITSNPSACTKWLHLHNASEKGQYSGRLSMAHKETLTLLERINYSLFLGVKLTNVHVGIIIRLGCVAQSVVYGTPVCNQTQLSSTIRWWSVFHQCGLDWIYVTVKTEVNHHHTTGPRTPPRVRTRKPDTTITHLQLPITYIIYKFPTCHSLIPTFYILWSTFQLVLPTFHIQLPTFILHQDHTTQCYPPVPYFMHVLSFTLVCGLAR